MTLSTGPAAGFYIFIDTDRDMVVLYNMLTIEPTDLSYTGYRADNEDWDQHATYTVAEFFPMLKQMWRTTELVSGVYLCLYSTHANTNRDSSTTTKSDSQATNPIIYT